MGFVSNIQVLRAVAAMAVVVFHARLITPIGERISFDFGNAGVDIFFVMSGFIIAHVTARKQDGRITTFLLRRAIRIVPLYWILTLTIFLGGLIAPGLAGQAGVPDLNDLVRSLAFVPYRNEAGAILPVLFMGWTLNYEMFFYVLFALALSIASPVRRLLALSTALIALVGAGLVLRPASAAGFTYTDPLLLEFVAGMWISVIYNVLPRPGRWLLPFRAGALALVVAGFTAIMLKDQILPWSPRILGWGLPAVGVVLGTVTLDSWGWRANGRTLMLLGDSSYCLYLTHPLIIKACTIAQDGFPGQASSMQWLILIGTCILCAVVAIIVHLLVERPLMNGLRDMLFPPRPMSPAQASPLSA